MFLAAAAFCVNVFVAVDRHSHSVSDTLYGVFPFFACAFLLVDWVAQKQRFAEYADAEIFGETSAHPPKFIV